MAKAHIKVKIRIPHVTLDARGADPKLIKELAEGLETLDARFRILGANVKDLAIPHAFSVEEALEDSHIWVVLSEQVPAEFNMITERGIVPVALRGLHSDLQDYNAVAEVGNAFLYPKMKAWPIYGSIIRALENYNFTYDWKNLRNEVKTLSA